MTTALFLCNLLNFESKRLLFRQQKESKMKKAGRILLIFNEIIASLTILIPLVFLMALGGTSFLNWDLLMASVLPILYCLMLPLGLIKPGWPLSGVFTTIGAFLVSTLGIQWMIALIKEIIDVFGLSFEIADVINTRNPFIYIPVIILSIANIAISLIAAWNWSDERRAAFLQSESEKPQKSQNEAGMIIQVLILAVTVLFFLWTVFDIPEKPMGFSIGDIISDLIDNYKYPISALIVFLFVPWFADRTTPKVERPADLMKAATSCLEKETIRDDMEALALLEKLQLKPQNKDPHSRAELLVMISQVQYRLGYFDKAKESIREALELDTMIVKQEGVYTDAILHRKAALYDVSCRISGTLKDYGQELDDCMTAIHTMENYANTNAYRIEIANAYIEKADAQRGLGQYGEALEACARASAKLEQVPSDGSALEKSTYALLNRVKAEILLDSGRIDEAEECASKSIKMYDGMREGYDCAIGAAHLIMSKIQSKRGNSEKAEGEYLAAKLLIRDRYGKEHPIYKEMIASPDLGLG